MEQGPKKNNTKKPKKNPNRYARLCENYSVIPSLAKSKGKLNNLRFRRDLLKWQEYPLDIIPSQLNKKNHLSIFFGRTIDYSSKNSLYTENILLFITNKKYLPSFPVSRKERNF